MICIIAFVSLFVSTAFGQGGHHFHHHETDKCPEGSIIDSLGKNCCPSYCGHCGDDGCHLLPGGEFECCPSTFKYSCYDGVAPCHLASDEAPEVPHDSSVCPEDSILDETGSYCCPKYCGRCGGNGCHLLPGGEYNCCWSTFRYSCHDGIAPCKLEDMDDSSDSEVEDDETPRCPAGSISDAANENCCPYYCNQCGGDGCHLFPGGEFQCCPDTFRYSCHDGISPCHLAGNEPDNIVHDASVCPELSVMDQSGQYCCPAYCGRCGGEGCHLLPGGEYECCWSTFLHSCFDGVAPCKLEFN